MIYDRKGDTTTNIFSVERVMKWRWWQYPLKTTNGKFDNNILQKILNNVKKMIIINLPH